MVIVKPQKVTQGCLLGTMPKKQGPRKSNKKHAKHARRNLPRFQSYQPRAALIEFPHVWRGSITEAAAGLGITYTWRANSLFDPDFTGAGVQPLGFDQWSALYSTYRVWQCDYEITFANLTSTAIVVGIVKTPNAALTSTASSWLIERDSKSFTLGPKESGQSVIKTRGSLYPWKVLNVTKQQYLMDGRSSAAMTGNPTSLAYLTTFLVGFGTIASVSIMVKFKYKAQLISRTEIDMS